MGPAPQRPRPDKGAPWPPDSCRQALDRQTDLRKYSPQNSWCHVFPRPRSDKGGGWRRRRGEGPPTLYTRFPVIWSARPWWRSPTAPREDHPLHRGRTASGPLSRRPGSTRGCWSPKSHSWHLNTVLSLPGVAASLVGGKRPLPRTFQRSRWGQNSGGTAAPVHHCPRWLSKPKKGLGGDIRQLATRAPVPIPPHHSLKM